MNKRTMTSQEWFKIKYIPSEIRNTKTFEQFYRTMTSDLEDFTNLNFIAMCEHDNRFKKYISDYKNTCYRDGKKDIATIEYFFNDSKKYASKAHIKREYDFINQIFSFTHKGTFIETDDIERINLEIQNFDYIENFVFHIDKNNKIHIFQSYQEPKNNEHIKLFCYHTEALFPQTIIFKTKSKVEEYIEMTNTGLGYGVAIYSTDSQTKFIKWDCHDLTMNNDILDHKFYYYQQHRHRVQNDDFQSISKKEYLAIAQSILTSLPKKNQKEMSKILTKTIK